MEEPVRRCPYCDSELRLVNVIERFGERPKVRILQCTSCNEPQFSTNGGEDNRWERRNPAAGVSPTPEAGAPVEQRFPVAIVGLHGLLAVVTVVLVFIATIA